jgi:phosphate transport system protein
VPTSELMEKLRQELAAMSEMVETNVNSAIMSLIERSHEMAEEVIAFDTQIDEAELDVERLGLEILQLAKPKSDEFHFVIAAIKIAGCLERISDFAVDVGRNVQFLVAKRSLQADLGDFAEMLEFTGTMVRDSVLSLLDKNEELAFRVCAHDELVDQAYRSLEEQLHDIMATDAAKAVRASRLLVCAIDLERIADLATNIAEDVVYMLTGKLVHHHIDEWRERLAPELDKRRTSRKREL